MKKRTPVSTIMTAEPITVNKTNSISDVATIFGNHSIHHVPVVSGDELIGMISKTDLDRISYVTGVQNGKAASAVYDMLSIEEVMTKQVETIQADGQIKEAAELFAQGRFHALPVIENNAVKGIVTTTDVLNYLIDQY